MIYRKHSLSPQERVDLAWRAYQQQGFYGAIRDLAVSFGVSRWLVYHLLHVLVPVMLELATPKAPGPKPLSEEVRVDKRHLDRAIVTLRVEGNVPLEGIQRSLEEILGVHRSIGYLSGVIAQAQHQASAFQGRLFYGVSGTGLLDELFRHRNPLLVVVELHSTALLVLSQESHRDGDTWGVHLLETEEQGFHFTQVASDGARGIASGVAAALGEELSHQLDIGHLFGDVAHLEAELERSAYKYIQEEAERWHVLDSARSDRIITSRIKTWEQAHQKMEKTIWLYEDFHYLAEELYSLFSPIGPQGADRCLTEVQQDLEALLCLLEELPHPKVQELRKSLTNQQKGLLVFWEDWECRLSTLQKTIPQPEFLQALLLDYFLRKRKPTQATQLTLQKTNAFIKEKMGDQATLLREQIASTLDDLIRSSALVETANSWLSPYLNTRKGSSQPFLDLIRLYRNTRTYRRGKRKGHSPFELLGISLPKDWLEMVGLPRN